MKRKILLLAVLTLCLTISLDTQAQKTQDEPIKLALAELQAGKPAQAISILTEFISKHPSHVDSYLLRGNVRLISGEITGALSDFNRVIQLRPDMGQAFYQRAYLRLLGKDVPGALQDLDTAIAKSYKVDAVYTLRAQLRMGQSDLKGGLADLDEAIKLNPNNPQTYAIRAGVLILTEDRERALVDLNYLLTWYEADPAKRRKAPQAEDLLVAIKTENQAPGDVAMLPLVGNAYANRGLIHSFHGKAEAAISDYNKAIRIDPKNMWAYFYRAKELEGRGDLEAALADVNRAIQIDPLNGNFRVEHGVVLTLMGNKKDAQSDFDMLLRTDRTTWQKRIDERLEAARKKP
ncbi:MAG: hypothetical protein DMF69_09640 [Acidobacteria bacterium]|nr:MAG: hypothetical protein DMF69_09640 [Acidobacteriota bacterium]